jgi:hypothetical protein
MGVTLPSRENAIPPQNVSGGVALSHRRIVENFSQFIGGIDQIDMGPVRETIPLQPGRDGIVLSDWNLKDFC